MLKTTINLAIGSLEELPLEEELEEVLELGSVLELAELLASLEVSELEKCELVPPLDVSELADVEDVPIELLLLMFVVQPERINVKTINGVKILVFCIVKPPFKNFLHHHREF